MAKKKPREQKLALKDLKSKKASKVKGFYYHFLDEYTACSTGSLVAL